MTLAPLHPDVAASVRATLGVPDDFPLTEQDVWDAVNGTFDELLLAARMPATHTGWRFQIGQRGAGPFMDGFDDPAWILLEDPEKDMHVASSIDATSDEPPIDRHRGRMPRRTVLRTTIRVGPYATNPRASHAVITEVSGRYASVTFAALQIDSGRVDLIHVPSAKVSLQVWDEPQEYDVLRVEAQHSERAGFVYQIVQGARLSRGWPS